VPQAIDISNPLGIEPCRKVALLGEHCPQLVPRRTAQHCRARSRHCHNAWPWRSGASMAANPRRVEPAVRRTDAVAAVGRRARPMTSAGSVWCPKVFLSICHHLSRSLQSKI